MTVFGTRPEAIKMASLVKELESREEKDSKLYILSFYVLNKIILV